MTITPPFPFKSWIEDHRHLLKPPVGNKCLYHDGTFIVMVVGGPNARTDFHVNQTDEFFYQLEGDIFLRIINTEGHIERIDIRSGDVFMLPAGIPHSPQRSEDSVGLVVELKRPPGSIDALQWYCSSCESKLYEEKFYLENIETQFGAVFDRYYNSDHVICAKCSKKNGKTWE
ncbi:3-hydroxyanthranilate 3,4-dioxygenase [Bacteriovoracaceae bacterium]|nr:3-hydroxyanthranilate 3,4-dioxygenase [Bacteriovoracaceae bacterium]